MPASLMPMPKQAFYGLVNGVMSPIVGGKVYTYEAGTLTPKDTYTTAAGNVANTNPVILDSRGEASIWLGSGSYDIVLKDSADATIWTQEGVSDAKSGLISVKDFGAVGDGVTSDQTAVAAAVARCYSTGNDLYWPDGTYLTTASIPNFHDVKHYGPGVIARGDSSWAISPNRTTLRSLYVSPTGDNANDGLTASQPMASIQTAVNIVHKWGPVVGRQQIIGAAGTYAENVALPDGLAQENNYLEFKFPSAPGVRGDPSSWPAGGAILDGTGLSGDGFSVGRYNKVYIEYLLVRDWYDTALGATQQVVSGITVGEFSLLYTYGVSAQGNGWNNIYVKPFGAAIITGGIIDGARYGINNTAGRLSLTANDSTYTTVKNSREYGLYAKHNSSSVLDYSEFLDCGQVAGAESYGSAIFSYKSGTSVDTRNCTFKRNNIVYHSRSGGHIATETPSSDVLGTGADLNDRVWKINGFGNEDTINYRSLAGRELSNVFSEATTTSASTVTIIDNIVTIPAQYFQSTNQYLEIEIYGTSNSGTATVRPTWTSSAPENYGFGVFSVATDTNFKIRLLIYPTGASSQFFIYDNVGATSSGLLLGNSVASGVFGSLPMTFKVRGEITAGTLEVDRVRVVLWG